MSKKRSGRGTVIEGIQADSVQADVLAVGHKARATKTVVEAAAAVQEEEALVGESGEGLESSSTDFSRVEAEFKRLKAQFGSGDLTESEFKSQLEDLMIEDGQGRWWILGYESGLWYYHDGKQWIQSEPPPPV